MNLSQLIDDFKETLKAELPEEVMQILKKGVEDQLRDGVGRDAITVGDRMPPFQLRDACNELISSDEYWPKGHWLSLSTGGTGAPIAILSYVHSRTSGRILLSTVRLWWLFHQNNRMTLSQARRKMN